MPGYVALLRAVNVGGTGKLPMEELKGIGEACGFGSVRTYIASGNLLFASRENEARAERMIAERLEKHFGRPVPVFVRTAEEMAEVIKREYLDASFLRNVTRFDPTR